MAPALALRGLSEFETGAYDDALRDLELDVKKGAADEPRNEQIIRFHLAELLGRAGRFEEAVAQYDFSWRAMEKQPLQSAHSLRTVQ